MTICGPSAAVFTSQASLVGLFSANSSTLPRRYRTCRTPVAAARTGADSAPRRVTSESDVGQGDPCGRCSAPGIVATSCRIGPGCGRRELSWRRRHRQQNEIDAALPAVRLQDPVRRLPNHLPWRLRAHQVKGRSLSPRSGGQQRPTMYVHSHNDWVLGQIESRNGSALETATPHGRTSERPRPWNLPAG